MEYPPKGNDIAIKFVEKACNLDSFEPTWDAVWLKAKGRVRRYSNRFSMPDISELNVAKKLCFYDTSPIILIQVAKVYSEAANVCKFNSMSEDAYEYYSLSNDLLL